MKKGFTLIELLIVVAIIAILAAIAVPNFMEAQVRSKVAREKGDMRNVRIALESFRTDNSKYPTCFGASQYTYEQRYRQLTTPVSYMTGYPYDVFGVKCPEGMLNKPPYTYPAFDPLNPHGLIDYWRRDGSGNSMFIAGDSTSEWMLRANGPDGHFSAAYLYPDGPKKGMTIDYDPTNGTTSIGDVFIFGP